ncbi:Hypothetical predicted protein [Podarcis lilfordi]|uniref:Uncharacterized protein n=1 Tax=Podarcis lilfordi TaxID=74358 RepID=A0AA35NV77_9SAUR|nr:Hypothetical predicted protein [Podarcis lilfordi]
MHKRSAREMAASFLPPSFPTGATLLLEDCAARGLQGVSRRSFAGRRSSQRPRLASNGPLSLVGIATSAGEKTRWPGRLCRSSAEEVCTGEERGGLLSFPGQGGVEIAPLSSSPSQTRRGRRRKSSCRSPFPLPLPSSRRRHPARPPRLSPPPLPPSRSLRPPRRPAHHPPSLLPLPPRGSERTRERPGLATPPG